MLLAFAMMSSCAKIVAPEGGEMDKTPPVVLSLQPTDSSVNFSAHSLVFEFDEFFTLKPAPDAIFLSPITSLHEDPVIKG